MYANGPSIGWAVQFPAGECAYLSGSLAQNLELAIAVGRALFESLFPCLREVRERSQPKRLAIRFDLENIDGLHVDIRKEPGGSGSIAVSNAGH
jgi:hypothetical protein